MNKSVKISQYITVNTKNMTTKIVNGLKTDSDSKTKVIRRDNRSSHPEVFFKNYVLQTLQTSQISQERIWDGVTF